MADFIRGVESLIDLNNQHSIEAWFTAIQLRYYATFLQAGFDDMTQLLEVHKGDFRITDDILREDMGIDKIGHVRKLIMKLDDEVARMPGGRKNQMATAIRVCVRVCVLG